MSTMRISLLTLLAVAVSILTPPVSRADDPPPGEQTPSKEIYDVSADGEAQIAKALERAKRDNKRCILMFGANWCPWCHKLNDLFEGDKEIRKQLLYEYELVLVDVGRPRKKPNNEKTVEKYGNPIKHGLPVLVVLDGDGTILTTQETGSLEKGKHHDPARVLAFLKKWTPKPKSASRVLATAKAKAKKETKRIFLHFSAPWCVWCHRFEDFLEDADVSKAFGKAYIPVKIDLDRMMGAKELEAKYRKQGTGGIPFFVILDENGKKLADSNGPKGNIGCPVAPHEISHFLNIVNQTAPQLSKKELATLEKGLIKLRPKQQH